MFYIVGNNYFVTVDTTIIRKGGEKSEGPDAQCKGKHNVYYKTKEQQRYMKTQIITRHQTSKGEDKNWGATPLVGYPSGRLHTTVFKRHTIVNIYIYIHTQY